MAYDPYLAASGHTQRAPDFYAQLRRELHPENKDPVLAPLRRARGSQRVHRLIDLRRPDLLNEAGVHRRPDEHWYGKKRDYAAQPRTPSVTGPAPHMGKSGFAAPSIAGSAGANGRRRGGLLASLRLHNALPPPSNRFQAFNEEDIWFDEEGPYFDEARAKQRLYDDDRRSKADFEPSGAPPLPLGQSVQGSPRREEEDFIPPAKPAAPVRAAQASAGPGGP